MRIFVLLAFAAMLAPAGSILTTQTDACLDGSSHCSGAVAGTLNVGGDSMSWSGNTAIAAFGILHVATDLTGYSVTGGTALSYGYVGFSDFLTISDPALTGQTGTLNVSYLIDGIVGHTGGSSAFLQVVTRVCTPQCVSPVPAADNYVRDYNPTGSGPTFYSETVAVPNNFSFTYGTQFELYFSMQATAGTVTDSGSGYTNPITTGSGSGYANFADTLILNGLQTGDPNAAYSSTSNTVYTAEGVVPEPATWLLCLVPFGLMIRRKLAATL